MIRALRQRLVKRSAVYVEKAVALLRPLSSFNRHVHTRITQFPEHRLRNFVGIRLPGLLRCCQVPYDFPLTLTRNFAIVKKGRQNLFMSEILAPRLELFWRLTDILAELDKCISEAVRVEIRQASLDEGFAEYRANRRCAAPVPPFQTGCFKLASRAQRNARCREKRIVIAP